jgi:hypothetical protein
MARFVDLDDSEDDDASNVPQIYARRLIAAALSSREEPHQQPGALSAGQTEQAGRASFSAALTCYPYATINATH